MNKNFIKHTLKAAAAAVGTAVMILVPCTFSSIVFADTNVNVSTWDALYSAVNSNDTNINITLEANINSNSELVIAPGKTITLNLNGKTLDRGLGSSTESAPDDGGVILNQGTLAICDNSSEKTGTITGGYDNSDGGGIENSGTLILENVTISNNNADRHNGGGIYNSKYGRLTIIGCTISNNTADQGGGIYNNADTLIINGCTITGNKATISTSLSFDLGGGIYSEKDVSISGVNTVTNNTRGDGSNNENIALDDGAKLNVTGSLAGSRIGITKRINYPQITANYGTNNSGVLPQTVFFADNSGYCIDANDNGEAYLREKKIAETYTPLGDGLGYCRGASTTYIIYGFTPSNSLTDYSSITFRKKDGTDTVITPSSIPEGSAYINNLGEINTVFTSIKFKDDGSTLTKEVVGEDYIVGIALNELITPNVNNFYATANLKGDN